MSLRESGSRTGHRTLSLSPAGFPVPGQPLPLSLRLVRCGPNHAEELACASLRRYVQGQYRTPSQAIVPAIRLSRRKTSMIASVEIDDVLITLTADIVAAHVSNNSVAVGDLQALIQNIHGALSGLGQTAPAEQPRQEPAVSVRSSVKPDFIVCLEDGKKLKMLKRHLMTEHGMTPGEYLLEPGEHVLNPGRRTVTLAVQNTAERPMRSRCLKWVSVMMSFSSGILRKFVLILTVSWQKSVTASELMAPNTPSGS